MNKLINTTVQKFPSEWSEMVKEWLGYLRIEKGYSPNTIDAYLRDLLKFCDFLNKKDKIILIKRVREQHVIDFIKVLYDLGMSQSSVARITSAIKGFFSFLSAESKIESSPVEELSAVPIPKKLPKTLSAKQIESMILEIDHSTPEGVRNRAIVEILYACGIRVSELINLKLNQLFLEEGYIRVIGKGNKERIVPIGSKAIKQWKIYWVHYRKDQENVHKEHVEYCFLGRRGKRLSRNMVFMIIRDLAKAAEITFRVGPHTLRHSFATHLVEGGADLRSVQEMLGHASITTTELYTYMSISHLKYVIEEFHPLGRA